VPLSGLADRFARHDWLRIRNKALLGSGAKAFGIINSYENWEYESAGRKTVEKVVWQA
jgi:hypothetical protein